MTATQTYDHNKHFGRVAIGATSPETVNNDYFQLLDALNYSNYIDKQKKIMLKINLSWTKFYPACSTPPWALESVIQKFQADGYDKIVPVENQTVVTKPFEGLRGNRLHDVLDRAKLEFIALQNVKWVPFEP